MPKVTVITGTYNRLALLRRMVESARLFYADLDFVIADCGSTDGTREWLAEQADVTVIDRPRDGAVKSFNACARAATGAIVVIANDDMYFESDCIGRAVELLEADTSVGQVAFGNLSDKRALYDSYEGRLYGQCCAIWRWLGNLAGWWGEGYYTYAGDTQLGLRMWELGYKVIKDQLCMIHDIVEADALRKESEAHRAEDRALFVSRWQERLPKAGLLKPGRPWLLEKARARELRSLRFKIVPKGAKPRTGLVDALGQYGVSRQFNQSPYGGARGVQGDFEQVVFNEVDDFAPDLLILQTHSANEGVQAETIGRLRSAYPKMVIANINADVRESTPTAAIKAGAAAHRALVVSPDLFGEYKAAGGDPAFWSISAEDDYIPLGVPFAERDGIIFTGSNYGQAFPASGLRASAVKALADTTMPLSVYGTGWRGLVNANEPTYENHALTNELYNQHRLALSVSNFEHLRYYTSDRLFMLLASGTPTLVHAFPGHEDFGLLDGVNCLLWETVEELIEKAQGVYNDLPTLERLGVGAAALFNEHNWFTRARELLYLCATVGPAGSAFAGLHIASGTPRPRPSAPVKHSELRLPGHDGLVLLRYRGTSSGSSAWYCKASKRTYYFSALDQLRYVETRDVPELLGKYENFGPAFERVNQR